MKDERILEFIQKQYQGMMFLGSSNNSAEWLYSKGKTDGIISVCNALEKAMERDNNGKDN